MIFNKKYRWRNAIKSLLFIAGFGAYSGVGANHILGGEITYSHISAHTYKFTVKVYRNCNECDFNTNGCPDIKNLEVYASPEELGFAKKLKLIPLTRISKRNVTPLCNGVKSQCVGGIFPLGIEENILEGLVNFDTVSIDYCRFEVAIREESRYDVYGQGSNDAYYNFARLNICNGQKNNSSALTAPVAYLLPQNQSFTYNILAKDADGDSLSYHLVKAQKAWGQNTAYAIGYDENKPVSVYCPTNCDLNKTVWPIEGAGIESESGWMGFTPVTSGQKGYMVVEVREWRKISNTWVVIGITRRDNQVEVISSNNYVPKISSSGYEYYACTGSDFQMDMVLNDPVYGGVKDSLSLSYFSELGNGKIQKIGNSKNVFDAFFKVPVSNGQLRNKPYYVTIIAQDDNCPLTATTYRTISITATTLPKVTPILKHTICNKIALNSGFNKSNYTQAWFVYQGNNLIESGKGNTSEIEVPNPGKYYVVYQLTDDVTNCQVEIRDSIEVPYFSLLSPNLNWVEKVCSNEEFELSAGFKGGTGPFKYWWNGVNGLKTKKFTLPKDSNVLLEITDANGCKLKASKTVSILPRLGFRISDTSLCLPTQSYKLQLKNRIQISGWADSGVFAIENITTGKALNSPFEFTPAASGKTKFGVFYTDKNKCHYDGTFDVIVVDPVPTGITTPTRLCSNNEPVDLNTATQCQLSSGTWTCKPKPLAVIASKFSPATSGAGIFELYFQKDVSGCLIKDTTQIIVKPAPVVYITEKNKTVFCATDADFQLTANIPTGKWENSLNSFPNNLFSPKNIGNSGKNGVLFKYQYTDITNGCTSTDSIAYIVNSPPSIQSTDDIEVCETAEFLLSPNPKNLNNIALTGNFNGLKLRRVSESYLIQSGNVDKKEIHNLYWKLSALEGCKDLEADFAFIVKPTPEFEILAQPDRGCVPFNSNIGTLNPNINAIPSTYTWVIGGKTNASKAGNLSYNITDVGLTKAVVVGELEGCKSEEKSIFVQGFESPEAKMEISPKNRIVSADFANLEFTDKSKSTIPYSVYWQFESGSPATAIKPTLKVDFPKDTGLYRAVLTVTTIEGCSATDSTRIRVRPGLQFYVPTSFTPDLKGPLANERFKIVMDSTASFNLTIRNKWGEIVFKSENNENGWDGYYLGKMAPAGVYVWELEANTIYGMYVRKGGTFLLMR